MRNQFFLTFALLAASVSIALAKPNIQIEADFDLISEIEYGIVCFDTEADRIRAPGTMSGYINQRDEGGAFIHHTRSIPMLPGVSFGVQVALSNDYALENVLVSVQHPPQGENDIQVETWITDFIPTQDNGGSFTFEYEYERTPGLWTFEAEYQGTKIYSVTFDVIDPREIDDMPKLCEGEALLG